MGKNRFWLDFFLPLLIKMTENKIIRRHLYSHPAQNQLKFVHISPISFILIGKIHKIPHQKSKW